MIFIKVSNITKRHNELIEIIFDDYLYFYSRRKDELNEIMLINKNFNNSMNYLMRSLKNLIILRKKNLLIIQSNDHVIINSNFNKLNLTLTLSFRNVINLKSLKDLKI